MDGAYVCDLSAPPRVTAPPSGNRLSYGAEFHPGSFIPSPAGNTSFSTAGFVSLAVHPRVCAEHSGMPFCGTPESRQDRIRSALNKPSLQSKRYGKYYRNGVKEKAEAMRFLRWSYPSRASFWSLLLFFVLVTGLLSSQNAASRRRRNRAIFSARAAASISIGSRASFVF